mgnify:CR=1 FL=1
MGVVNDEMTVREAVVFAELDALEKEIALLDQALAKLQERLKPVLIPGSEETLPESVTNVKMSPLAVRILGHRDDISTILLNVIRITGMLEI